jgi:hypothetical protein
VALVILVFRGNPWKLAMGSPRMTTMRGASFPSTSVFEPSGRRNPTVRGGGEALMVALIDIGSSVGSIRTVTL